jgi:hypothetical protein
MMSKTMHTIDTKATPKRFGRAASVCLWVLTTALIVLPGCAAFRPMDGVPARYLPEELKGRSRAEQQMIDLSMLRRPRNSQYRVDTGDVLAVYIENILGKPEAPPINQSLNVNRPPTLGYPLTVRDDGTLPVPRFGPINVRGKTLSEVEAAVRHAFTYQRRFMQPGQNDRVIISLHQPRQHRVLVVRQESTTDAITSLNIGQGSLGNTKKGNGKIVSLPAYKNDVMHALVESGGLPGLDAKAVVWVIRAKQEPRRITQASFKQPQFPPVPNSPYGTQPQQPFGPNPNPQFGPPNQFGPTNGSYPPNANLPVIMGPTRRYPAPANGAINPNAVPNSMQQPLNAPAMPRINSPRPMSNPLPVPGSQGLRPNGMRTAPPNMIQPGPMPTARSNRAPNNRATNDRPAVQPARQTNEQPRPSNGIQLASYSVMKTPRQIAESLTGIPMPPPTQAKTEQRRTAFTNRVSQIGNSVTGSLNRLMPGHVAAAQIQQSGCSTCQTGVPMNGPMPAYAPPMQNFAQMPQPMPNMQFNTPPMQQSPAQWQPPRAWDNVDMIARGGLCNVIPGQTIRIPLRLDECDTINFNPQDVVLNDGDIVFIESRDDEVFYTGGLLGGGQYGLPRDSDIDILEAIAISQSANITNQGGGRISLNNDVTIGASQAIVLRKLPNGSQVSILVDLYRARKHPVERIAIRPGDYIILQYTKVEAVGAFFEKYILEGALFGVAAASLGSR